MVHLGAYFDRHLQMSAYSALACLQTRRTLTRDRHRHSHMDTLAITTRLQRILNNKALSLLTHRVSTRTTRPHPTRIADIPALGTATAITHHKDLHRRMRTRHRPPPSRRFRTNHPRHRLRNPTAARTRLHSMSITRSAPIECTQAIAFLSVYTLCLMASVALVSIGFVRSLVPIHVLHTCSSKVDTSSCSIQRACERFAYFCVYVLLNFTFFSLKVAWPPHTLCIIDCFRKRPVRTRSCFTTFFLRFPSVLRSLYPPINVVDAR